MNFCYNYLFIGFDVFEAVEDEDDVGVDAESGWYFFAIIKYCFFILDFDVGIESYNVRKLYFMLDILYRVDKMRKESILY